MASSSTKLSLKLFIDPKREIVPFAETSKAVVDFLFTLLCLPIGTVIRILDKNQMVGSLSNLYQSLENLDETYMQKEEHKDLLLKPSAPVPSHISGLLPSINGTSSNNSNKSTSVFFYRCPSHLGFVTCDNTTPCPQQQCGKTMNSGMYFLGEKVPKQMSAEKSGFVKEGVTYMVMDDLVIHPLSSIALLTKLNVKDFGTLQEKVVNLLKASLQSKTVLTDVFLNNHTLVLKNHASA
ncbi:hypothetical protein DEO72_LG9g767 [Vigna unguiculata]|uniref:DUF674 domain-containing protein n=1 Tax=Vigna unguiculata TaxID=3917 RepID=A0A4D6MYQ0_VIGUN|nr:hypothetical protein DEO72_LG9g767 [Vigna unguiculata]